MKSCLYRCRVSHKRKRPKIHDFAYSTFMFCIDLDELALLEKSLRLFSLNARNIYSLRNGDHLDQGKPSIKENVVSFLKTQNIDETLGRIELVTNLRTWGYVFNPVSFYFIYSPEGPLIACLAEVANTFNEQKLYLVDQFTDTKNRLKQTHEKLFYISPFSEPDTNLHFDLQAPSDRIELSITESDGQGTYFYSSLSGTKEPLTNASLLKHTLRFPFITVSIIAAIHWQALRLTLKKVPFFKKSHRLDQQTDTRVYIEPKKNHSA